MRGFGEGSEDGGWRQVVGWRMGGFEDPERVFSVSNNNILPFDLEVTGSAFEEGRAWEGEWVERGFWWHGLCSWCFVE